MNCRFVNNAVMNFQHAKDKSNEGDGELNLPKSSAFQELEMELLDLPCSPDSPSLGFEEFEALLGTWIDGDSVRTNLLHDYYVDGLSVTDPELRGLLSEFEQLVDATCFPGRYYLWPAGVPQHSVSDFLRGIGCVSPDFFSKLGRKSVSNASCQVADSQVRSVGSVDSEIPPLLGHLTHYSLNSSRSDAPKRASSFFY